MTATADTATSSLARIQAEVTSVLGGVLDIAVVDPDAHFFDDLGADSMMMARFCARIRRLDDLPPVSMKDVYQHPTAARLAAKLADRAPAADAEPPPPRPAAPPARTREYVACGALQLVAVFAYLYAGALVVMAGLRWIADANGLPDTYLRAVGVGAATFLCLCAAPVLAKWLLVGRWAPGEIRVWSPAYLRFWVVKTLIQRSPLVLFAGSPLYVLYLRCLGARIGPGVVILSRRVPVVTDLLTIGPGAVIRKDTFFTGYRAEAGVIRTGSVTLGAHALVGEAAVLDIGASLGHRAQLGHASSLGAGEHIPADERREGHGAVRRTEVDYRDVPMARCGRWRRAAYATGQLVALLAAGLPLGLGAVAWLVANVPQLAVLSAQAPVLSAAYVRDALVASAVVLLGTLLGGLLVVGIVPRLLAPLVPPDRAYRLYGVRYGAHRAIERLTNVRFFPRLLGDSSYIVWYLRWLGYDLSQVQQTGSNFGLEVKQDNPFLCTIGRGTMVADGLSIINTDYSHTSFRVSHVRIGARSFLGNYLTYSPRSRVGDNCLVATKATIPLDGPVRRDTGLLGAPAFEIPRSVQRDGRFDHLARGTELRRRLAAKNRHNAVSIVLYLLTLWLFVVEAILLARAAADLYPVLGAAALAAAGVLLLALRVVHFSLVERLATGFRDLRPQECSIYQPYFWWHERFWKLAWQPLILDGTPFKSLTWRLLGVRIGRRVFDDGCAIVEKTMVSIGDDCTLNVRSVVQPHSQEDGAFKSDRIAIGRGCTLGIASLVHYGARMGDHSVLAPDSFLMKGEDVPAHARWGGNPAREL